MMKAIRPKYAKMIGGGTDTEHLAALYLSYLDKKLPEAYFENSEKKYSASSMWAALQRAVQKVEEIQKKQFGINLNNTLNLCASRCSSATFYTCTEGRSQRREPSRPLLPHECFVTLC
jgi:hypothetical protein